MSKISSEPYKVSVLVPVYGVERFIEKFTRSIFEQTYHNLEIIFVDDCTPDRSIKILRDVLNEYPNRTVQTTILRHEHNRGLAAARNTLLYAATGKFVTIVDSDDWIEPDMIDTLVTKQIETNADIVSANFFENDKTINPNYINPNFKNKWDALNYMVCLNLHHEVCGRLYQRSLFIANDIHWAEGNNICEDLSMTPRLLWYARNVAWVDRSLYHYVKNESSLTHSEKTTVQKVKAAIEAYNNFKSVMLFFKDKDVELYGKARLSGLKFCYCIMYASLNGLPKLWREWHKHLLYTYSTSEQKAVLGCKVAAILHFPLNYYILRIYFKLAEVCRAKRIFHICRYQ